MKPALNTLMIALLAVSPVLGAINFAEARSNSRVKVSYDGFQSCKAIPNGYIAKVRGRMQSGGRSNSLFNISYCFNSSSECERFLRSIPHIIYPIEDIYYSKCRTR